MNNRYGRGQDERDSGREWSGERSERWGMGNTSDESDRFRQDSERRGGYPRDLRQDYGPSYRDDYDRTYGSPRQIGAAGVQERGPYFGKGPKGYKRSDERIKEDVNERLSMGHVDASDIEVQVKDGEVTLTGTVPHREMKRRAEEIIDGVSGVHDVANQIRVKREETSSMERGPLANGDAPRRGATQSQGPQHRPG